jgi:HEAT repeat protein
MSALADIALPSSRPIFLGTKMDKDVTIRTLSNEGLGRLADATLLTTMSADRLTEKNARVQTAQAFGLLRLGRKEYLDELVRALEKPGTKDLAREYLMETKAVDRPALFASRPKNALGRAEFADVLGLMGDKAALPTLQELEQDNDATVVRNAERAVRRISVAPKFD